MKVDESTIGQAHFGNAPGKFEHGPYWLKKAKTTKKVALKYIQNRIYLPKV